VALLEIREVSVSFGGLLALDRASIEVESGQVTGLIGPNGAGKTTLFNVVTGLQNPTSGVVRLDGKDITRTKKHARARIGIARTFQRLEPFGSLTARENVLVALEMRRRWAKEKYDPGAVADELLDRVGIGAVANRKVDSLPTGTARLVELARALGTAPRVLLLDEPSSGLSEEETDAMGKLLLELAATGLGILLVEHDMSFVMGTCGYINVLDFGRIIAHGHPDEIQIDPEVQRAYLGVAATESS
jgi:branched-chain amino acid transport system ATP-binding protein